MNKAIALFCTGVVLAGVSVVTVAKSTFGLGGSVTYVTLDSSKTLPTVGGTAEPDAAVGGNLIGHLNLADEGFLRYFATELAADYSRHKVKAKNTTVGNLDAGKLNLLLASWSLLWMMAPDWNFCPYIGAGVSYANLRKAGSGQVDELNYTSKWGGLAQAGIKYYPSDAWSIDFDVKKVGFRSGSEPKLRFTETGISGTADFPINPLVVGLGATFYFE